MKSLQVAFKNTRQLTSGVSNVLWSAGAVFAVSFASFVFVAVILLMMCLVRLADLSEKREVDALDHVPLLGERTARTINGEFRSIRARMYFDRQTQFLPSAQNQEIDWYSGRSIRTHLR